MAKETAKQKKFHIELVRQMLTLATAGFGLVAALAWNGFIQELVKTYIAQWFPDGGSILSLFFYAVVITIIAVLVTYHLSKLLDKVSENS